MLDDTVYWVFKDQNTNGHVIRLYAEVEYYSYLYNAIRTAACTVELSMTTDIGNDFNNPRRINGIEAEVRGCLDSVDRTDTYVISVPSNSTKISITMTPPADANYDIYLYNPNQGQVDSSTLSGNAIESINHLNGEVGGDWFIKVILTDWPGHTNNGIYDLFVRLLPPSGGGPHCPFVSVWNGNGYAIDNNVLPKAELSNRVDVEDYYRLEQRLVPRNGRYSLVLSEFESEHDFFDQVQLLAVDHPASVSVAVSSTGQIFTYTNPYSPTSAITNDRENVKHLLSDVDETYYQGYNGSYVDLNFGDELDLSHGARLVLRTDMKCAEVCIKVQVQEADGDWATVEVFTPRRFWSTDIIDMSQYLPDAKGHLKVRLAFTANHKLDFVGLDTSPQTPVNVQQAELVSAWHSQYGDVANLVLYNDGVYAELVPGQQVQLEFTVPENSGETRTYIFYSKGYYTIR